MHNGVEFTILRHALPRKMKLLMLTIVGGQEMVWETAGIDWNSASQFPGSTKESNAVDDNTSSSIMTQAFQMALQATYSPNSIVISSP